jgi:hypothetical protein
MARHGRSAITINFRSGDSQAIEEGAAEKTSLMPILKIGWLIDSSYHGEGCRAMKATAESPYPRTFEEVLEWFPCEEDCGRYIWG